MHIDDQDATVVAEDRRNPTRRAAMEQEAADPAAARRAAIAALAELDRQEAADAPDEEEEERTRRELQAVQQKLAAIRGKRQHRVAEIEAARRRALGVLFRTCDPAVDRAIRMLVELDIDMCNRMRPLTEIEAVRSARKALSNLREARVADPVKEAKRILGPLGLAIPSADRPVNKLGPEND